MRSFERRRRQRKLRNNNYEHTERDLFFPRLDATRERSARTIHGREDRFLYSSCGVCTYIKAFNRARPYFLRYFLFLHSVVVC